MFISELISVFSSLASSWEVSRWASSSSASKVIWSWINFRSFLIISSKVTWTSTVILSPSMSSIFLNISTRSLSRRDRVLGSCPFSNMSCNLSASNLRKWKYLFAALRDKVKKYAMASISCWWSNATLPPQDCSARVTHCPNCRGEIEKRLRAFHIN